MHLDLSRIHDEPFTFDCALDLAEVTDERGAPLVVGRVELKGEASRTEPGVWLAAHIAATLRVECCRCLAPHQTRIETPFGLLLVDESVSLDPTRTPADVEEAEIFFTRSSRADLAEIAAEQIHLNLPLKWVCRPDCAGLCPGCGANRNRIQCGCRQGEVDPRLAPLLELKKRIATR
jgi:uncharacterized protein